MFLEREYEVAQERRKDTVAWVEKQRLIRTVQAAHRPSRRRYQRWLARLGAGMVRWGSRLQARYADTLIAASALHQECSIESNTSALTT
jgi:hypothetical protein